MSKRRTLSAAPYEEKVFTMFDAILIAAGVGFFLLSIAYAAACNRL
jgi:hypothetical protein